MLHKKCNVAADDHQDKPAVHDPNTGIFADLQSGIKPRHMLNHRYHQIAFSHFIKSGEPQRKDNLNRVTAGRCQNANVGLPDIVIPEFCRLQEIFDFECSQIFRQLQGLIHRCFIFIHLAGMVAGKA